MKNSVVRLSVVALALALTVFACKGREAAEGGDAATATIERAAPQPEPTGTDALTETVSMEEESRSTAEGGVLANPQTSETSGTTSTETTATTTNPLPSTRTR